MENSKGAKLILGDEKGEAFYAGISFDWQERAKRLRARRWKKINKRYILER